MNVVRMTCVGAVLCLSACGALGGGGTPDAGGPVDSGTPAITADQACTDLVTATCNKLQTCFPLGVTIIYGDAATCIARNKLACPAAIGINGSGYVPDKIEACARAYSSLSCDDAFGSVQPAACDIRGTLVNGTACGDDVQCASGHCKLTGSTGCGVCADRVAVGQACTAGGDCTAGNYCDASAHVCKAFAAAGSSCSTSQRCKSGLYCHAGTCTASVSTPGAACTPAESQSCSTFAGLWCNTSSQVCSQIQTASAGNACGMAMGSFTLCTASSGCKPGGGGSGSCVATAADGAACDPANSVNCLPPAKCTSSVCRLPAPGACN